MSEVFLVYATALILGWPLGKYLSAIMTGKGSRFDSVFAVIERPLLWVVGKSAQQQMDTAAYIRAFLVSNLTLGALVYGVFLFQGSLPLNPDGVGNLSWDLALHTMVSFLTNTNQQHYSGQAQLSYLSQTLAIVTLQFLTPIMGMALAVATLRKLMGSNSAGNFWTDLVRPGVRFFLPLALVLSLLLSWQGVPSTLAAGPVASTLDSSVEMTKQKIPLGPVAPMVAIKQLGTNGGGWYGPNSSVPLENPTPLSNFLQTLALILIPVSLVFMVGYFTGKPRFAALVFGVMLSLSVMSTGAALWAEASFNSSHPEMAMEGKEQRFTEESSVLWAVLTTQTSNGSVNNMHDSLAPLTGLVLMINMLINAIWGGIGCGLSQFVVYLLLSVFLSGLMTGRSPELFGRKIESGEVRLLGILVLLQPVTLLAFTAFTFFNPGFSGVSNPGAHGLSQVFYEYLSAFANNGSGFEGLGDGTLWWNLSATLVLILGRYPALIIPLLVASKLAEKRVSPAGEGTLRVDSVTFGLVLIAIILVLTLLQFLPVLMLGPVAEHLSLIQH